MTPFLDVIRSETTSGPITGLALTSVEKFLAYGLLEASAGGRKVQYYQYNQPSPAAQDMVVLMKIVHLLRTLMLVPAGYLLSNEMVFEILQNCLRICLETKLSELLRRTAEQFLCSIVQLFFSRLPALIAAEALLEQPEVPSASRTPRMFPKNHFAVDERKDPETATYQGDGQPAVPTDGSKLPPQQDPEADISGSVCSLKDHLVQQPSSEASQPADTAPEEGAPVTFVRSPSEIGMEALECQSPAPEEEALPQLTSQVFVASFAPPSLRSVCVFILR
ncbi:unnamed protein product [Dibothriocephalus latus]|uniref:Mon2/Sec7/BIG1-like HUS domain-containing protein n=1 Tax=Dibothriocephalus latus TaxID=60516 RepID=A0A3P7LTT6_DIBLA|nr:unnamed protein product [Dibothriocephalus latus]